MESSSGQALAQGGGEPNSPHNWWPIALTSCLGKLLYTIIAARITEYATTEGIMDTTIQKGFLPKLAGCVKHTAALSHCIRHSKKNRKPLCMVQYDLANAFGSVPHEIIIAVLKRAHIDPVIIHYIRKLYENAEIQLKLESGLTEPINVHIGVLQGDTLSPILFNLVMETIIRYVRKARPTFGYHDGQDSHFCKAFADDVTFLTQTPTQAQEVAEIFETALSSLLMKPNTSKCRVYCLGQSTHRGFTTLSPKLVLRSEEIPHIADKGTKFLGMILSIGRSTPRVVFDEMRKRLRTMMTRIDQSKHAIHARMWMYENAVLSRMHYLLTVHDGLTLNLIKRLQKTCSRFPRKWVNLAAYAHPDQLYIKNGGWGLTSMTQLWREYTVSCLATLQSSSDIHSCHSTSKIAIRRLRMPFDVEKMGLSTSNEGKKWGILVFMCST